MTGLSALLSLDTSGLDARIAIAADPQGASPSFTITDPLDLLGEAGTLIRTIEDVAGGETDVPDALRQGFAALGEVAPFADIPAIEEVMHLFEALKERLQPLHDLMDLDPAALVNHALEGLGGTEAIIGQIAGGVTDAIAADVPEAIAIPLGALRDLAAGTPGSAGDVAAFFARFLLGLDLAALRAPFDLIEGARGQLAAGSGDAALEARILALTLSVDAAAEALLDRDPELPAIVAALGKARAEIDLLTASVLPGAIDRLSRDISGIDVAGLAVQLGAALAPLLARVPVPPRGLADFFLPPLRMLGDGIDALTPALFSQIFAELEAKVRATFAASDVARLRDDAASLLAGVVGFLNRLPLPALREQLTQALLRIQGQVGALADFSPVTDIAAKMQEIADAIDGIDTDAVKAEVAKLAAEIEQVVATFPIEAIRDELEGLLGQAEGMVAGLPPLIEDLKAKVDSLADELTSIDLSGAGDVSVGLVADMRSEVKTALGSADIPAALKIPLGVLAGAVREIELSAAVEAPLADIVARVDVSGVLAPVQAAIDQAREALRKLSPTAVMEQLDQPFDAMIGQLQTVSPEAVIGQLSAGFQAAAGQIDRLNPATLAEPLQAEFDALLATLRQAADPSPLLAPLHAAYAELQALLDAIDPTMLIGRVIGEVSKLPGRLTSATSDMMAGKIGAAAALPQDAAGGPIRFGDMVRPLAALVNEARAVVRGGAEDLLAEGLELIGRPLALLVRAGEAAGGHLVDLAAAIEARRALVDPTAPGGPMAELHEALARLARIEAGLAASGRSSVQLNGAVLSIQLDVYVTASLPARQQLDEAAGGLGGGLQTAELSRSLHALGLVIADFVPPALALPDTEASVLERIDALFDTIDPTPIADEMDAIGAALEAKLQSFATEIAKSLFKVWNAIFEELLPVLPQGILPVLTGAMDAIRAQLAALDPASLEAELDALLDSVVEALQAYSPAAFAGTLSSTFDAVKSKLLALDPAVLLGDLDPLAEAIEELEKLRPSVVLAPLTNKAEKVDAALVELLEFDPAQIVAEAIANLKLQIELVLQRIEVELDGLLADLGASGGAEGSISF
jgi:hypothetical protein